METELKGAREVGSESALRERIHSLKTLCELVLDEPRSGVEIGSSMQPTRKQSQTLTTQPVVTPTHVPYQPQPQAVTQSKKIEMDDGANGDSLLDF